jgi:hypothetical protein
MGVFEGDTKTHLEYDMSELESDSYKKNKKNIFFNNKIVKFRKNFETLYRIPDIHPGDGFL